MQKTEEQMKLAAKLLRLLYETIKQNSSVIKENNAVYFSEPVKGGRSLIVGQDKTVLFANSSVGYSRHMEEFKNGKRTPLKDFI